MVQRAVALPLPRLWQHESKEAAVGRVEFAQASKDGVPFRAVRFAHLRHHRYNRTPWGREEVYDPTTRSRPVACALHYLRITFGLYVGELALSLLCWLPRLVLRALLGALCPDLRDGSGSMIAVAERDVLVAHNAGFDMAVIAKTSEAVGLEVPDFRSLCSLQVARKTYHLESYRLPVAAMAAGFEDFSHHDALADAEACAAIIVHAAKRHEAGDVERLAHITRVPFGAIGPVATRARRAERGPMALQ